MSRVVWKYPLERHAETVIELPIAATPVLVALDPASGDPTIWIELDPNAPRRSRRYGIYGTGHRIVGDGGFPSPVHIASIIEAPFVWHVYEHRAARATSPESPAR